ncbi:two-component sensor histidine kinase [Spirochaetia bacterium]|nr:two-component sensor histidine kinase [Spirochaetia bacterium]
MRNLRSRPKYFIINVRGLLLIYVLLCILTILFSRTFFLQTLEKGSMPEPLSLVIFFTIPVVLLVFLVSSALQLLRDIISRQTGSRFQARLLVYFIIIVALAATPVTVITFQSVTELARFYRTLKITNVLETAGDIALDAYSLHLKKLEDTIQRGLLDGVSPPLPEGVAGIQDFDLQSDGSWKESLFRGNEMLRLKTPPGREQGFVTREIPRDTDHVRYIMHPGKNKLRLVSYFLGTGFDFSMNTLENERAKFEIINSLDINLRPILILYYGMFFLPTLLMTMIIALSFTRRVTQPIAELSEATRRVAEGDFSIRILDRRGDELGLLIRSFNAMVEDLEKSRADRVKEETISIWQTMAQQLAHEIKNPLTPIRLSAERVLRRWQNDPERLPEILESSMLAIIQEVESLSTLLNEFRTLSRPMEPSTSWTPLRELVRETVMPYANSHPHIAFDITQVDADISLKIDKHHLAQALTNLFINAIDAMDSRGSIEIRGDLVKKRESVYCRISIRDTGKGISKQDGARIFTPYFTTKESGTGLGLPIVERIINDHGGAIWFDSAEGVGTTFFIDLPGEADIGPADKSPGVK